MKKFKFLIFTLFTVLSCISLVSCSDDDDDKSNSFENFSWRVVTSDDEDDFPVGMILTFKSDGNATFIAPVGWKPEEPGDVFGWQYAKWARNENELTIVLGEDEPDDKVVGSFVIKGKNATYTYHWADYYGYWDNSEDTHVLTLSRI